MPVPSEQHQIFAAEEHLVWLKLTYLSSQKSLSFANDLKQFFHFKSNISFYLFFWMIKVVKTKTNDMKMEVVMKKNDTILWTVSGKFVNTFKKESFRSYAWNQPFLDDAYLFYGTWFKYKNVDMAYHFFVWIQAL